VKTRLLRTATAALLFASLTAVSADDAKPAAAAPHSALWSAFMSAARELQAAYDPKLPMRARLERLLSLRHSPETAALLVPVFGTDQPVTFTLVPAPQGQFGLRAALMPLQYTSPDGMRTEWSELSVRMLLDQTGRKLTTDGNWQSVDTEDKDVRFKVRDIALSGSQYEGAGRLWFGSTRLTVGSVVAELKSAAGTRIALEGLHQDSVVSEHARTTEMRYDMGIKGISVGSERIDDLRMAMRVTNIDKKALADMKAAGDKNQMALAGLPPEQALEVAKPMIKAFARAAIARGAAIEIDDFSAAYQGIRFSLKGRVSVEGALDADLDSPAALGKKVVARFDLKIPLALVRTVAGAVASKQAAAQGGPDNAQGAAQIGQTITDVMVGKLVGGGFARVDNDVLVTTIELRGGKLRANGKEVPLPTPKPAPVAPATASDQLLQARRIEQSCRLPDYPDEVIRDDAPLELTLRLMVGADGHVGKLAVAKASRWPAYDQAALAAASGCTYIPALNKGKPVPMPAIWRVVREPGSTHP
jgi:TonB family protein